MNRNIIIITNMDIRMVDDKVDSNKNGLRIYDKLYFLKLRDLNEYIHDLLVIIRIQLKHKWMIWMILIYIFEYLSNKCD